MQLNGLETLALCGIVIFAGYAICRVAPLLTRLNIPAPVLGGLLVALIVLFMQKAGYAPPRFDTALQAPLMIAFFTTIGFAASLSLLKKGGTYLLLFLFISSFFAVLQNLIGMAVAIPLGIHPLFGVLAGSVTLTGGPATGLAFAPLFEKAGVAGASTVAIVAAMSGIISGGLIGSPIGTWLIERRRLRHPHGKKPGGEPHKATEVLETSLQETELGEAPGMLPAGEDAQAYALLKNLVIIFCAMAAGAWISALFVRLHITLPAYIGAMIVGAFIRNMDDRFGLIGVSQKALDDIGSVALSLFIAMSIMNLHLLELANLALPLLAIIAVQVIAIVLACAGPLFRLFGGDYEAAVMSSGFCGFMLGTTANAIMNMSTLTEKYGPAPRAFLVVPLVGAFFIDMVNALIITGFLNFWT